MKKPFRERPIIAVWTGEHFVPLPRFMRLCDQQFAVHEEIPIVRHHERNMNQHRAYFAALNDAFDNLAEDLVGRFPSAEHLREWALCQTEFCTTTEEIYDTKKDATQAARALRKMAPYAIISVVTVEKGAAMVTRHAMSQSVRAMGKETFEASCRAVLGVVAGMARTTPRELKKNAGRAA